MPRSLWNLSIPYPFGVGLDCSLDPSFNVSCDTSTAPPKAYLTIIDKEVIEINDSYVRVKYPNYLASACYDLSDYQRGSNLTAEPHISSTAVNLSGTQYTLSDENWLTAIGCDDMVVGIEQPNGSLVGGSCGSICGSERTISDTGAIVTCPDNGNWSMLGDGCCRARISGGTNFLRAQLTDLSGALPRRRLFHCSYAFIQESGIVNQSGFSYNLDFFQNNSPPVVQLDWRIGTFNCSQHLNDPLYGCRSKRGVCVDNLYNNIGGYLCSCANGYVGNPYLPEGCLEASSTASFSSIAKPGCLDQCGDLSIPFPFGIGKGCYMEPSFNISCDRSTNPPKAYLVILNVEITKINGSQIWVNYPNLAIACYNFSDHDQQANKTKGLSIDISATQYTLSTENLLTVIGCDDMVVGYRAANRSFVGSGCVSFCPNRNYSSNYYGYCPYNIYTYQTSLGCCVTPISKGTNYLEANLGDVSGQWRRRKLFSCSFAFVTVKRRYPFQYLLNSLNNSTAFSPYELSSSLGQRQPELVLDWRIGAENCNEAQRNGSSFACEGNTTCVDFDASVGGYLCNCSEGYKGNPYLTPGCQDINECDDNTTNPCDAISNCINIPGSATCLCPKGYYGDGRKDGKGCIQQPPSKSKMIILIVNFAKRGAGAQEAARGSKRPKLAAQAASSFEIGPQLALSAPPATNPSSPQQQKKPAGVIEITGEGEGSAGPVPRLEDLSLSKGVGLFVKWFEQAAAREEEEKSRYSERLAVARAKLRKANEEVTAVRAELAAQHAKISEAEVAAQLARGDAEKLGAELTAAKAELETASGCQGEVLRTLFKRLLLSGQFSTLANELAELINGNAAVDALEEVAKDYPGLEASKYGYERLEGATLILRYAEVIRNHLGRFPLLDELASSPGLLTVEQVAVRPADRDLELEKAFDSLPDEAEDVEMGSAEQEQEQEDKAGGEGPERAGAEGAAEGPHSGLEKEVGDL